MARARPISSLLLHHMLSRPLPRAGHALWSRQSCFAGPISSSANSHHFFLHSQCYSTHQTPHTTKPGSGHLRRPSHTASKPVKAGAGGAGAHSAPRKLPKSHKSAKDHARRPARLTPARVENFFRQTEGKTDPSEPPAAGAGARYIEKLRGSVVPLAEPLEQAKNPDQEAIPKLAHRLDRVLFSPGVHFLQDPRTRVFNFPPMLKKIVPYEEFDWAKVGHFVSALKDQQLLHEATRLNKTFYLSTSSMTLTLKQFYLFLNNYSGVGQQLRFDFPRFTKSAELLALSVIVEPKGVNENTGETIWAVTSDKLTDTEILLGAMGHCLEALLTTEEEQFKDFLKGEKPAKKEEASTTANIYNYSAYGDFLMRSQLDCYDARLPGHGTFDLKTRAVCAVRYDRSDEAAQTTYQIWKLTGNVESFEREFQDLVRTGGLLKYGFQARIGQMDGIFVAYHNITSFFGFQYLPLSEIDKVFYSHKLVDLNRETYGEPEHIRDNDDLASFVAEDQFKALLLMWQDIMKTVVRDLKGTSYEGLPFRLVLKRVKLDSHTDREYPNKSFLSVFAVPLSPGRVAELQDFSAGFQTLFREDIASETRAENLEQARQSLNRLNSDILDESVLLSYKLRAALTINGQPGTDGNTPYPLSRRDKCQWRYRLERLQLAAPSEVGAVPRSTDQLLLQYTRTMEDLTEMLSKAYVEKPAFSLAPSFLDHLRKFAEVGRMRMEKWKNAETPPKVY